MGRRRTVVAGAASTSTASCRVYRCGEGDESRADSQDDEGSVRDAGKAARLQVVGSG